MIPQDFPSGYHSSMRNLVVVLGSGAKHFSPTSVQFKSEINGECSCKRHQKQHLEFFTTLFGTRRSVVQIHSPRPIILKAATYGNTNSRGAPGPGLGSRCFKSTCLGHLSLLNQTLTAISKLARI